MLSRELVVLAAGLSVFGLIIGVAAYPYFHNHYVHPLGRLSRQVVPGDSCASVAAAFSSYIANEAGTAEADYSDHLLTYDLLHTRELPAARGLSLYDLSPFDDLQLRVRCDSSGVVAEALFIGD